MDACSWHVCHVCTTGASIITNATLGFLIITIVSCAPPPTSPVLYFLGASSIISQTDGFMIKPELNKPISIYIGRIQ